MKTGVYMQGDQSLSDPPAGFRLTFSLKVSTKQLETVCQQGDEPLLMLYNREGFSDKGRGSGSGSTKVSASEESKQYRFIKGEVTFILHKPELHPETILANQAEGLQPC